LLGFSRTLPLFSPRPPLRRSPAFSDDCGIDWTVSVSTVIFRVPSGCRDFVVVKAGKLFLGVEVFDFGWWLLGSMSDARGLFVSSLLFPPPSLSLSPVLVCFSLSSYSFLGVLLLSSCNVRRAGFRSAAACTAAALGSVRASELFSCTVSNVDFPLGPRDGIFVEACNDDWSPLPESDTLCFPLLDEIGGGGGSFVGVAPRMLILGGAGGAVVVDDDVFAGPASSAFFPITEAIPVCRAETRDEGGGLFNRGDAGHCGVVSPEAGPALFVGPARAGNLDTASVTAPLSEESWGTLLADKAL
jgi:hypothetical protein